MPYIAVNNLISFLMVLQICLVYFLSEGFETVMSPVLEIEQPGRALLNIWHRLVRVYLHAQLWCSCMFPHLQPPEQNSYGSNVKFVRSNTWQISYISTLFLYSPPSPPTSKYMYTNVRAGAHTYAVHSQLLRWVALRMTELVTHSPIASLTPRGRASG